MAPVLTSATLLGCAVEGAAWAVCGPGGATVRTVVAQAVACVCEQCRVATTDGASGIVGDAERWFCRNCWESWQHGIVVGLPPSVLSEVPEPVACAECGAVVTIVSRELSGWQCPDCWLAAPGDALALLRSVEGCERAVQEILLQRTAPFAPTTSRPDEVPGDPLPPDVLVVWDALDSRCAAIARALHAEFVFGREAPLCRFAERRDKEVIESIVRLEFPVTLRDPGTICALLESEGVFMTDCDCNPKGIIYELMLRGATRYPSKASSNRLNVCRVLPLQRLCDSRNGQWWEFPEVLQQIGSFLDEENFAYIDGFLPWDHLVMLANTARSLHADGHTNKGSKEQRGWHEEFWGAGHDSILKDERRRWTLQGDHRIWIADDDARGRGTLPLLSHALDVLVTGLKSVSGPVAKRLAKVDFREYTMSAFYPGDMRARYNRHCDIGRGAILTTILYLNDGGWKEEYGGKLRLYCEGGHNMQIKAEVLPVPNRLMMFWSDDHTPHEVLCTKRDRIAMTTWFRSAENVKNGGGLLDPTADALLDLLLRVHPVAPLTLGDALRRAGASEERILRLQRLYKLFAGWGSGGSDMPVKLGIMHGFLVGEGEKTDEALEELLMSGGRCSLCQLLGPDGAMGSGDFAGKWFCGGCWQAYGGVPR